MYATFKSLRNNFKNGHHGLYKSTVTLTSDTMVTEILFGKQNINKYI